MNFYAIDFETASYAKHSACSVALVKVENSRIVGEYYSLIQPETDFFWRNIQIHGIRPETVADAPKFPAVWDQIKACFHSNSLVVAHNAGFDCGVLAGCLDYYQIEQPHYLSLCTVKTSRKLFPEFPNHRLNTVCENLNIQLDNHHDALEDSRACAEILIQQEQRFGTEPLKKMITLK